MFVHFENFMGTLRVEIIKKLFKNYNFIRDIRVIRVRIFVNP